MSDVDAAFRALILSRSGVTDAIGQRLYPEILPDNVTWPAVVYSQISDVPIYTNDNAHAEGGTCFRSVRYQIDSYGNSLADVRRVDEAIRAAIGGFRGRSGGRTFGAVMRQNSQVARYDDENLWRITTDYLVQVVN